MPAYDNNNWFALFFFVYVVVNIFIFMNILFASIYNNYKRHLKVCKSNFYWQTWYQIRNSPRCIILLQRVAVALINVLAERSKGDHQRETAPSVESVRSPEGVSRWRVCDYPHQVVVSDVYRSAVLWQRQARFAIPGSGRFRLEFSGLDFCYILWMDGLLLIDS